MILSMLRKRRSVRRFQKRSVETEKIEQLLEAALRAPSSRDLKPWEFVVVTDRSFLERLALAKSHGSGFLKDAAAAVVVCADPGRCDVWIEDCSIASILIQLCAESLGLGSCWVQIRLRSHGDGRSAEEYIRELLGLPEHLVVESVIGLGYPDETKSPHSRESLCWEKVHVGKFGTKPGF